MSYVVKNPAGLYLQDQGTLQSPDFPYGAPGTFGDRDTAYVFRKKYIAEAAMFGLLGPGRNATTEKV